MTIGKKDITFGEARLRTRRAPDGGWHGIIVGQGQEQFHADTDVDLVRKMQRHVLAAGKTFIGFDGARKLFLRTFSDGFASEILIGRKGGEIFDKRVASLRVQSDLGLEGALAGNHTPDAVIAAFRAGKMVDRFDIDALAQVLKSERGADFQTLLARFAQGEIGWACNTLLARFDRDGVANWSILSYLAAMWRPEAHAYMPRTPAQEFARRVGHPFAEYYDSRPTAMVYQSYLDMLEETRASLVGLDPAPTDYIDLESYIHLIIYGAGRAA